MTKRFHDVLRFLKLKPTTPDAYGTWWTSEETDVFIWVEEDNRIYLGGTDPIIFYSEEQAMGMIFDRQDRAAS